MKRLLNFRLIYLLLFFFLSSFFFYLAFISYKDYNFPYSKLSSQSAQLINFNHTKAGNGKNANESEKYIFELNSGASIYLYEGFDEIAFKKLKKPNLVGKHVSVHFQEKFRQDSTIYNPEELIIGDKTIIDFSKRKASIFKLTLILFSCGIVVLIVSLYLLSAIIYVLRIVEVNPKQKNAKRILGNWFIS